MTFRLNKNIMMFFISFICFLVFSCKSTDPFKYDAQNSALNFAQIFLNDFENPSSLKVALGSYEKLSESSKQKVSLPDYKKLVLTRYPNSIIYAEKMDISTWEKVELSDESVLVYMLKKYNFKTLRRRFDSYSIIRLHLIKENEKWVIDVGSDEAFSGFYTPESGAYGDLDESKMASLRESIKKDAEVYQFNIDRSNMESQTNVLAETCIAEGEKLYDEESYRKALMQFQKALSISPENEKAKIYINRCKKAINLGLGK
ncbi:MAG: hypothetical protein ACD_79C00764G0004 [uncultured bacterium]|nr:MAG: hypothetical protein ACD_79C00764G0004 [uncultured bacterium]